MMWTDPPYGVAYEGGTTDRLTIQNDDLDPAALLAFLRSSLRNALNSVRPGASFYVASGGRGDVKAVFAKVMDELGVWRQEIVWIKDSLVLGQQDYHWRHEAVFVGWKPGASHRWYAGRDQTTVWEIPRPRRSEEHPTMKPVELVQRAVANHTLAGDLILDPFAGSGTTLIAAHNLNRRARLLEIDPRYCDVICARFQQYTGIAPTRNGVPHDFFAQVPA